MTNSTRRYVPKGHTPGATYPVCDMPTDREAGDIPLHQRRQVVRAIPTGEKRPPQHGEWYLSGAVVGAYRAVADMSSEYLIAKLVRVRVVATSYQIL